MTIVYNCVTKKCCLSGNYGNMMDESVAPSNTPPCNAVYDGSNYYYLPWSGEKPCVCVESYWEDIAFRLEPLNALLRIIDRLVSRQGKAFYYDFALRLC